MSSSVSLPPFARTLRHLRTQANLTLYELGKRSGVARSRIMRMEQGAIKRPTVAVLNKLAHGLTTDPEVLYDAVWQTTSQPLPTLPTYLREKYHLRDDQIKRLSQSLDDLTKE